MIYLAVLPKQCILKTMYSSFTFIDMETTAQLLDEFPQALQSMYIFFHLLKMPNVILTAGLGLFLEIIFPCIK